MFDAILPYKSGAGCRYREGNRKHSITFEGGLHLPSVICETWYVGRDWPDVHVLV